MKKEAAPIEYISYTNNKTGEIIDVAVINHSGVKNKDFEMIFYGHLMDILNDMGNKRIKVLHHIVSNREKVNNTFIGTVREISESLGISFPTVQSTLTTLVDKGVIKRKTGVIYINSDLICDGRFKKNIMHKYNEVDDVLSVEERKSQIERAIKRKEIEIEELEKQKERVYSFA
jgi:predicted transcriptional regulator